MRTRHLTLAMSLAFAADAGAQTCVDSSLVLETYATGFTSPSFFRFLPTEPGEPLEFLLCQAGNGELKHYRDGALLGVAIDLAIATHFERGLFGIALHPDFAASPYVFLYYTASATGFDTIEMAGALDNRVVRWRWNGTTLDSMQVLMTLPVGPNHNGGALGFGPDGMLYGSIGEAGSTQGQMQNVASGTPPNDTSMIFRIRPDGAAPDTNPFFAVGGMQRVWAYGMRNVFGIDFDPQSGALWATDNGAATYDEIDRVPPGANGGWLRLMGPSERDPAALAALWLAPGATYRDPEFSFLQSFGITAIHFQRGGGIGTAYEGDLFVAAHNSMTVYRFEPSADRTTLVMPDAAVADRVSDTPAERDLFRWAIDVGVVTDMETGPDGALYILRYSTPETLYRVRSTATGVGPGTRGRTRLSVYPNPSRGPWTFSIAPISSRRTLYIYGADGSLVRVFPATSPILHWDGRDHTGRPLAAGAYFASLWGKGAPRDATSAVKLIRLE